MKARALDAVPPGVVTESGPVKPPAGTVAVACDVADLEQVQALHATALDWLDRAPRVVVNNAGIGAGGRVVGETSMADWQRTLGINLWGVIHGCHTFVPTLRAAGRGGVINVASAAGFTAAPRMAAYNVSKAAVNAWTVQLAHELRGSRIKVNSIHPGHVKTDMGGANAAMEDVTLLVDETECVVGADLARQLQQPHHVGGAEEMQADDVLGARGRGGDGGGDHAGHVREVDPLHLVVGCVVVGVEPEGRDGVGGDAAAGEGDVVAALEELLVRPRIGHHRDSRGGETITHRGALEAGEPGPPRSTHQ